MLLGVAHCIRPTTPRIAVLSSRASLPWDGPRVAFSLLLAAQCRTGQTRPDTALALYGVAPSGAVLGWGGRAGAVSGARHRGYAKIAHPRFDGDAHGDFAPRVPGYGGQGAPRRITRFMGRKDRISVCAQNWCAD